jgi:hypothetical protein
MIKINIKIKYIKYLEIEGIYFHCRVACTVKVQVLLRATPSSIV